MPGDESATARDREWLVVCLCADWCGTCRDYRAAFEAIAADFPGTAVRWIDIEDEADEVSDYEVADFPTILIQRSGDVLFYGSLRPDISHLRRLYESLRDQTPQESRSRRIESVPPL